MKTAVEYVEDQLRELAFDKDHHLGMGDIRITQGMIDNITREAKELEKQQIRGAFFRGSLSWATGESVEQYYNETYNPDEV